MKTTKILPLLDYKIAKYLKMIFNTLEDKGKVNVNVGDLILGRGSQGFPFNSRVTMTWNCFISFF